MKRKISSLTLGLLAVTGSIAIGQTNNQLVIRQEIYVVTDEMTRVLPAETFVLKNLPRQLSSALNKNNHNVVSGGVDSGSKKTGSEAVRFDAETGPVIATGCCFKIDHSEISEQLSACIEKNISKAIAQKIYKKGDPVTVTGYTCPLGSTTFNQWLSLERAKSVARFLRDRGYTVVQVKGDGPQNLVTRNPRQYRLNRRVEIRVVRR